MRMGIFIFSITTKKQNPGSSTDPGKIETKFNLLITK